MKFIKKYSGYFNHIDIERKIKNKNEINQPYQILPFII